MTIEHEDFCKLTKALSNVQVGMADIIMMANGHDEMEKVKEIWHQVDIIGEVIDDSLLGRKKEVS